MWKLLLVPPLLYLLILLLFAALQTRMLFPAGAVGRAGPLPESAERLTLETPGGETLHGVRIPGAGGPLILGFGGNAWNADAAADYLHRLYPQADIVAFHYRGYAPSTGTPSAAALIEDAAFVHDRMVERLKPDRVVAVGFSVGSGVAAHLAAARPLDGAILVTPFDSLAAVGADHYPWLPVRLLFRHAMEPAEALRDSPVPVAILAAEQDRLIPPKRTEALRAAVKTLVYERTVGGAGHNDIYERSEFHLAMREALRRIEAPGR
ncbi:MAG: alpha/beta hydrolase [Allosphingosinicella sp.]